MRIGHMTDHELQGYLDQMKRDSWKMSDHLLVEKHLQVCSVCREAAEDYEDLGSMIEACPIPSLSPGFTNRVMSKLPRTNPASEYSYHWLVAVLSPIAAVITLLLRVDMQPLWGRAVALAFNQFYGLKLWLGTLSIPAFPSFPVSPDLGFLQSQLSLLTESSGTGVLISLVCVALLLFATIENLVPDRVNDRT
jgi:hypothetical protein